MIKGLNLDEVFEYSLKGDTENPTVFKLGVLPSDIFARLSSAKYENDIEMAFRVLQVSLRGWDNLDVPFETEKTVICGMEIDCVKISSLQRIPVKAISELAVKAMDVNQVTEGERKN